MLRETDFVGGQFAMFLCGVRNRLEGLFSSVPDEEKTRHGACILLCDPLDLLVEWKEELVLFHLVGALMFCVVLPLGPRRIDADWPLRFSAASPLHASIAWHWRLSLPEQGAMICRLVVVGVDHDRLSRSLLLAGSLLHIFSLRALLLLDELRGVTARFRSRQLEEAHCLRLRRRSLAKEFARDGLHRGELFSIGSLAALSAGSKQLPKIGEFLGCTDTSSSPTQLRCFSFRCLLLKRRRTPAASPVPPSHSDLESQAAVRSFSEQESIHS
ncbi:hypothetical protein TGFOU_405040 [Toxoplasma gondii FOU]|uniref:Uncharacterized protein n=1 Tax=Toxoplasma gondii FOU TaxID=943167 RepID=A0A086KPV2_TOXGO|nr:hypothetical protein TGFOU_405040 [Toxoplasma gondii FOU]